MRRQGALERPSEVAAAKLRKIRKALQRDDLVEVRFDELGEFLLLPAREAAEGAGFVVDCHEIPRLAAAPSIASRLDVANTARPASQLADGLIAIPSLCHMSFTLDGEAQNARY
jgi:hypothetical protein